MEEIQKIEEGKPTPEAVKPKRRRVLTMRNVYEKKNTHFAFSGIWAERVDATPEDNGVWLIYGAEKNGKTTFALMLANYLRTLTKVLYMSAEEGISTPIQDTCLMLGIPAETPNLHMDEYMPIEDLWNMLKDRRSAKVVFIDNATWYKDELLNKEFGLMKLKKEFPDKLFIIIAHEAKGEPYNAAGKLASKTAKIIFRIQGLAAIVGGRVGGNVGKMIPVIEERAKLYHGDDL